MAHVVEYMHIGKRLEAFIPWYLLKTTTVTTTSCHDQFEFIYSHSDGVLLFYDTFLLNSKLGQITSYIIAYFVYMVERP